MRSNPNSIDPSGLSASSGPRRIQRGHPIFLLSRGKTEEKTLSKMMQGITLCYTQYFNGKYRRTERLWECRYHSTIVDEDRYLWSVSRYIENNPVRVGIAKKAEDYRFSSAKAHLLGEADATLKGPLFDKGELREYKRFMRDEENEGSLGEIRRQTRLGKPLGDESFLKSLSKRLNRSLIFRPKGRPKKRKAEEIEGSHTVQAYLDSMSLRGWGKFKIVLLDEERRKGVFRLYQSAFGEEYGSVGRMVCHCWPGAMAGAVQEIINTYGFDLRVKGREVKCRARGEDYCEFVVAPIRKSGQEKGGRDAHRR